MGIEIERRFLVKGEKWQPFINKTMEIRQGYLVNNINSWTIRVRIADQKKAWLTLKTPAGRFSQHEFEYQIPLNEAESIWQLTTYKLTKTRHTLEINKVVWIVDCFHGKNSPLVIAEIELDSEKDEIIQPEWCHAEITGKNQWSNASLAQKPLQEWEREDRPK